MKNEKFEQAKQAVAEKHGFSDFKEYSYNVFWRTGSADSANQEVAEWMCNEAVKADRAWTKENFEHLIYYVEEIQDGEFRDVAKFIGVTRDLPFPPQPDER